MSWFDSLPDHLKDAAYRAGSEAAWPRSEASEVVDHLTDAKIPVERVEVWIPTHPGPTLSSEFVYFWEDDADGSTALDTASSNEAAKRYIRLFDWDPRDGHVGEDPVFCLSVEPEI